MNVFFINDENLSLLKFILTRSAIWCNSLLESWKL